MKYLIAVVLLFAMDISLEANATEQKTVFCAQTYKYAQYEPDCAAKCGDCGLQNLLSEGWIVVLKTPKEIIKEEWWSGGGINFGCTCIGTQYVLSKGEKKVGVTNNTDKTAELLKNEIELLKKENEMLKQKIKVKIKKKVKKRAKKKITVE